MKKITTQAVITSISSKVDGSLGLRIGTPELSTEEKVEIMNLQQKNIKLVITPVDEKAEDEIVISADMNGKTPSQRQRAIIFVLFKQQDKIKTFSEFYERTMENIIDQLKSKAD